MFQSFSFFFNFPVVASLIWLHHILLRKNTKSKIRYTHDLPHHHHHHLLLLFRLKGHLILHHALFVSSDRIILSKTKHQLIKNIWRNTKFLVMLNQKHCHQSATAFRKALLITWIGLNLDLLKFTFGFTQKRRCSCPPIWMPLLH